MKFAPFNGAYPGHDDAMKAANLDPKCNLWYAIYDFSNDLSSSSSNHKNWSLLKEDEEDSVWCPLGPGATNVCPRIRNNGGSMMSTTTTTTTDDNSYEVNDELCKISLDNTTSYNDEVVIPKISTRSKGKRNKKKRSKEEKVPNSSDEKSLFVGNNNELINTITSSIMGFFGLFQVTLEDLSSFPSKAIGLIASLKERVVSMMCRE